MTQEEKQLLLKDLCARLPYKTYIEIVDEDGNIRDEVELAVQDIITVRYDESTSIRPYLRPMSSMTDEEIDRMWEIYESGPAAESSVAVAEYLYERHLDCHYMIEKGLALEATEGMYKTE